MSLSDHSFFGPTWDVALEECDVFTVDDAGGWGAAEWIDDAASGIGIGGDRVLVRGNTVRNVRFGISVGGDDATISHNLIDGFSADGLRGLGDGGVYEYNRIQKRPRPRLRPPICFNQRLHDDACAQVFVPLAPAQSTESLQ